MGGGRIARAHEEWLALYVFPRFIEGIANTDENIGHPSYPRIRLRFPVESFCESAGLKNKLYVPD